MEGPSAQTAAELVDWRRRVFDLYAEVRAAADPAAGHAAWRAGRDRLFAGHPQSPLSEAARNAFTGLPCAPYDRSLRFECVVDDAEPARRDVPTGTDGVVSLIRVGRVQIGALGGLDVWWVDGYAGGVFVPLRDGTAGRTTYGGGRYVLDTRKGADLGGSLDARMLLVDLNFAYHPSCAYDPAWACPLAPPGNVIDAPVDAGEQLPATAWY